MKERVDTGDSWWCWHLAVYERCHRAREKRPPPVSPLLPSPPDVMKRPGDRSTEYLTCIACLSSAAGSPFQPGGAAVAGRKTLVLALGCLAGAVLVTTYTG